MGKKSVIDTKNNIIKSKEMLNKHKEKIANKGTKKVTDNAIKVKNGNVLKSNKILIKTKPTKGISTLKNKKEAIKRSKQIAQRMRETARRTAKAVKMTIKAVIKMVKAIISATKALISLLIAGGWIVVMIIIIICLVGLLIGSVFGIFFASEDTGTNSKPMNAVIQEINKEFIGKVTQIQRENPHNEYSITSTKAEWKDVLAVYSVITHSDEQDVVLLDEAKINKLRDIFWEMNSITFTTDSKTTTRYVLHLTWTETVTETITKLNIVVEGKTAEQMADKYNFTEEQRKKLAELLDEKYAKMWNAVIYGSQIGNSDIVAVAVAQLGNKGGQTYWSWYGFNSRVEWCACFVSWCANELGYIESGIIPKFAGVDSEGIPFFKACELWQDRGYIPKPGDIIFFDWESDGRDGGGDHVGIVEFVVDGRVHTIEGNSGDECKQRDYDLNSLDILGYGTPLY